MRGARRTVNERIDTPLNDATKRKHHCRAGGFPFISYSLREYAERSLSKRPSGAPTLLCSIQKPAPGHARAVSTTSDRFYDVTRAYAYWAVSLVGRYQSSDTVNYCRTVLYGLDISIH